MSLASLITFVVLAVLHCFLRPATKEGGAVCSDFLYRNRSSQKENGSSPFADNPFERTSPFILRVQQQKKILELEQYYFAVTIHIHFKTGRKNVYGSTLFTLLVKRPVPPLSLSRKEHQKRAPTKKKTNKI
eukprot:GDKJ01028756.1.p1 GENE.GDKJ01028756.1~~GDKJ01028756.1.p1  ORF type:complete len:131 (-),score=22.63 GDKJ01028756.1:824-1216(-)